jgi:quercetin dioxygenase-like cupin family protein
MNAFLATITLAMAMALTVLKAQADSGTQAMTVLPNGTQPSMVGAPEIFVGHVRVDPLVPARAPSRVTAGYVTFEPGARSSWHTHPLGQTLVVTAGAGWIQQQGREKQVIKPGDVIWTPPGVKHWHGAAATTGMTHMAIQESLEGKNVDWLERVSDAQYEASR